jgi:hypothetical protein
LSLKLVRVLNLLHILQYSHDFLPNTNTKPLVIRDAIFMNRLPVVGGVGSSVKFVICRFKVIWNWNKSDRMLLIKIPRSSGIKSSQCSENVGDVKSSSNGLPSARGPGSNSNDLQQ